jgi:uncharacterized membrane-anchored protein YhcB (DUF1043 family)
MITTIIILNAVLIALVVGTIVGMLLHAIKTAPSEAQMLSLARERRVARHARDRAHVTTRPVFDR